MKLPYLSYKSYMVQHYGESLYTIPIDLDFGCPNRSIDGSGGCSFCPEHGARSAQTKDAKSVEEQIEKAVAFAKKRYNARAFSLYIQAYTGTFASVLSQKKVYEKLLKLYPFKALHIGTRPDCLSDETLSYLQSLSQNIDICIELGIQSVHDETLHFINRGHTFAQSKEAIGRIHQYGLKVYAHIIIGFPNESRAHWLETVRQLVSLGIDGIKIHNLHIIQNTHLAKQYAKEPFKTFGEYEYAEELIAILRYIPSDIPILRLSTDTPNHELIAPLWKMYKGQFKEYIVKTMNYRGVKQGDLIEKQIKKSNEIHKNIILKDGSTTFWSKNYKDYYHPKEGAIIQAQKFFIQHAHLEKRLLKGDVRILDIGFGMGYNTFEALKIAQKLEHYNLHISAIDQDRQLLLQSAKVVPEALHVKMLEDIYHYDAYRDTYVSVDFINKEARYALSLLDTPFDIIFLDPFLESNNATLVSVEFFQKLRTVLNPNGILVASTSLHVSQIGLRKAGFEVSVTNDDKSDIKGIVAKVTTLIQHEAGVPYHDSHGVLSDKEIESIRQKFFKS